MFAGSPNVGQYFAGDLSRISSKAALRTGDSQGLVRQEFAMLPCEMMGLVAFGHDDRCAG
jgi:hypothetical protein